MFPWPPSWGLRWFRVYHKSEQLHIRLVLSWSTTPCGPSFSHLTLQTFNSCTYRPVVSQCLVVQRTIYYMSKNRSSTSMANVACDLKLRSFVSSSIHLCPGNLVATGRAVVYNARAAHTFSAWIKCRHCISYAMPYVASSRAQGFS